MPDDDFDVPIIPDSPIRKQKALEDMDISDHLDALVVVTNNIQTEKDRQNVFNFMNSGIINEFFTVLYNAMKFVVVRDRRIRDNACFVEFRAEYYRARKLADLIEVRVFGSFGGRNTCRKEKDLLVQIRDRTNIVANILG